MTLFPPNIKSSPCGIALEDMETIRQYALANIATEILQVSDIVEENVSDLSDKFIRLVKLSRQQVEKMTAACALLSHDDSAHRILTQAVAISASFDNNVNRMIYSLQFQDRTRQLLHAMAITLDILGNLSTAGQEPHGIKTPEEKLIISEKSQTILTHLIEENAHKELDQSYIIKVFTGNVNGTSSADDGSEPIPIEFF